MRDTMQRLFGRRPLVTILGGGLFAFLLGIGLYVEMEQMSLLAAVILGCILILPFSLLLRKLFEWEYHGKGQERVRALRPQMIWGILFCCYLPALFVFFPGIFAYDVPFQLKQFFTGTFSTHHPLLHTVLIGTMISGGKAVGNVTVGAALYTVIQMALVAICFTGCIRSMARMAKHKGMLWPLAFYALYPLHMIMAVNATKDALFAACFAWMICLLIEGSQKPLSSFNKGMLVLTTIGSVLLRNNAIYALGAWAVFALAVSRNKRRVLAFLGILCLGTVFGISLKLGLKAQDGDIVEMLSLPIQQVARARLYAKEKLTDEELQKIDGIMPGEAWTYYDPTVSDPVKFEVDSSQIRSNPGEYLQLYLSVLKRCPKESFDAAAELMHGFLFPYFKYRVSGRYIQTENTEDYYDDWWTGERIRNASFFPRLRTAIEWRFGAQGAMQWPWIGIFFNMGVIVWATIFLCMRMMYWGNRDAALVTLIPLLLLGTYLLGPVMTGRYVYPFVCMIPGLTSVGGRNDETR